MRCYEPATSNEQRCTMVAVILAAGYGTRLYPLTQDKPKALLPVKGVPILEHLVRKLELPQIQTERTVLVSNHKFAPAFQSWAATAKIQTPCTVLDDGTTSDDDRLGSVGDLAFSIEKENLTGRDLLVLGGDNLFRDRLGPFTKFSQEKGGITLGAYQLPDLKLASQYGVLTTEKDGRITAFTEKPKNPTSALVSTAIYFFPSKAVPLVLEYTSSRQTADTLGSFISWLISRQSVYAFRFEGPWFDIGDMASYTYAQRVF